MDLQWLDDVLVLLEEGNMTRAAARRHITQPAFSRRIRSFEDWVGTELLDRQPNSVGISPALRSNEADIRALQSRIRDLRSKIKDFDPASSTISIAAQHAPVFSVFPDMALQARQHFPSLKFQLRAGDLRDCVTMFLRRDANILLSYESAEARPMPFGDTIIRVVRGKDFLVPVIGGSLRYALYGDGTIPIDTPAIVYPEGSHFGEVLQRSARAFSTPSLSQNALCETALSSGIKDLILCGIGIGWLPLSMAYREIESGDLVSLANQFGQEPIEIVLYAEARDQMAIDLIEVWKHK